MAIERILAVKLADLGDLLTATPALRALRTAYPHARISALVTPRSASLLDGSDLVDELIPFDKFAFDRAVDALRSLPRAFSLARRLRAARFDALALFHHLTTRWGAAKYAALAVGAGAPLRAGLDNGRGWFLNRAVPDGGFGSRHEVDHWLGVAAALGGRNPTPRLELRLAESHRRWAVEALRARGLADRPVLALHPGSGSWSTARRWLPDRFAAVATRLAQEYGLTPLVLAGPAAGEQVLAREVASAVRGPVALLDDAPGPLHLAALLEACRLLICNDGGPMHLATAVETPVVAIFGPSNDRAWGPYPLTSPRHAVVRHDLPCSPCIFRGHRFGTPQGCPPRTCLYLVDVDEVVRAAERVLAAASRVPDRPRAAAPAPAGAHDGA